MCPNIYVVIYQLTLHHRGREKEEQSSCYCSWAGGHDVKGRRSACRPVDTCSKRNIISCILREDVIEILRVRSHKPRSTRAMSTISSTPSHGLTKSALSQKHILYSEILAVTSVMRKNSRWASSHFSLSARDSALASSLGLRRPHPSDSPASQHGSTERDLMLNFQELKREIRNIEGTPIPLYFLR